MVNLFVSVYNERNKDRMGELMYCLERNIGNDNIDKIHVLLEPNTEFNLSNNKISVVKLLKRPTFGTYFDVVNSVSRIDDVNIIINSDIYFDEESVSLIKENLTISKCFALTRYDVHEDLSSHTFLGRRDSQDSWCFKGKIRHGRMFRNFCLGKPGCDNRIAHEIHKSRYHISNPSKTIKSYHLHNTQVKSYSRTEEHIVKPPYLRLDPIAL